MTEASSSGSRPPAVLEGRASARSRIQAAEPIHEAPPRVLDVPSPTSLPMSEYGKQKSGRYAFAHTRIQEAMKAGFYLEAITITESMITDRLLASRDHLMGEERKGRRTLGALLQKHLNDEALRVEPAGLRLQSCL